MRRHLTRGLTIFIFHEVTDRPSPFQRLSNIWLSLEAFQAQIDWITRRFHVVAPTDLSQFGGSGRLPDNAALLTFDDSWDGIFRSAVPLLRSRSLPSLCFVNMATVEGEPDLAAAFSYEDAWPQIPLTLAAGEKLTADVHTRLGPDRAFRSYQGPTASPDDLDTAASKGYVWFGSHLYHHWDIRTITDELYADALARNDKALRRYPNRLPVMATPHGYAGQDGRDIASIPRAMGLTLMMTGTGNQNPDAGRPVLDRLFLPTDSKRPMAWWYATHRRRVVGQQAS